MIEILLGQDGPLLVVKRQEAIFKNARTDLAHELVVEVNVVLADERPAKRLLCLGEMMQVSSRVRGAHRAGTGSIQWRISKFVNAAPQLDDAARGFSFRAEGPLDMRMDPSNGISVRQWLGEASEQTIAEVLTEYGEERFAVPIAKAIAACVRRDGDGALATTTELARLVATVLRGRRGATVPGRDPATRTFQALRIFINQELDELTHGLAAACDRLAPAGRLAVISFHSLEDRIVKRFIAHQAGRDAPRHPVTGAVLDHAPTLRPLGRWLASEAEIAGNPRARSAVLRAAEKC